MNILIPVLIVLLHVLNVSAEERKPVSLGECIDIALKGHPTLKASEKNLSAVEEQYKEAFSSYYPKVSIDASYTRSEAKALSFTTGESETYQAFLKLEQKIYDFGRTGGSVDASRSRIDSKGGELLKTKQEVIFGVKEAYFGVLKAMGLMKVQEAAVRQAESHLRQARGFYEAGAKAKFDVTKAEVELNEANLALIKARSSYEVSLTLLRNRMGVPYNYALEVDPTPPVVQTAASLDEGIGDALKRRPEMLSMEASLKEGEGSRRAARGGYYPSINASASYGYYDQHPAGEGENLIQEKNERWSAGLSINVPIFEGFLTRAKVAETSANIDGLRAQRDSISNNITLEVTQTFLEMQDALSRIGVAESGLNKAKENLDLANGRYEAGVGTIIEVTDAQAAYIRAETDLVNARYDAAIARARFDRAVGLK